MLTIGGLNSFAKGFKLLFFATLQQFTHEHR